MHCSLKLSIVASIAVAVALPGCASLGTPVGLEAGQTVAVVNSLSWDNPLSGKRDGVRTSWPLKSGNVAAEYFPLAQLKQCDADNKVCAWGVMRAWRDAPTFSYVQGGVNVSLALEMDVARRQQARQGEVQTSMTIPQDVSALELKRQVRPALSLKYGKVEQVDLDYGVRYQVCMQRYDAAGKVIDRCEIPYI